MAEREKRPNLGGDFYTPLRYPGGKGRLGPWLASVIEHNNLSGGWYIEPYAGGAGAALYLLANDYVDHIVINDVDPSVHAFWWAVTKHPAEFIERIARTPVTITNWERQRDVLNNAPTTDRFDLGFATFFLNRTNRSGILSAGAIGGRRQTGHWTLDARYNKEVLSHRIRRIGAMAKRISVTCLDALDLLTYSAPGFPDKTLIYLDPPYFLKGSLLYRNFYVESDHVSIARHVSAANYPVIVSYDNCIEVRKMYAGLEFDELALVYSTHSTRPLSNELVFYRNLLIPNAPKMTRSSKLTSTL